jgi:four helix bundle protein
MGTFQKIEEIDAWQKARVLTNEIYKHTKHGAFVKDYVLADQMRRACISVMSNIAEGFERSGTKEFAHFLSVAKGSCGELKAQIYVAFDLKYINKQEFDQLFNITIETGKMIGGLMGYLRKTTVKGSKFR